MSSCETVTRCFSGSTTSTLPLRSYRFSFPLRLHATPKQRDRTISSKTKKHFCAFCAFLWLHLWFELGVVEALIGPVIRHHFVDVILRLRKTDLGNVAIGFVCARATDPAREVVGAAVVRTGDCLRLIWKLLKQVREILRAEENRRISVVEIVLLKVLQR